MKFLRWIPCALAAVFLAISLLTVLPAPTRGLWQLSLVATECGTWLALVSGALAGLVSLGRGVSAKMGIAFGLLGAALFLSPLLRGVLIARDLTARLDKAFGAAPASAHVLSVPRLFGADQPPVIPFERHRFDTGGSVELDLLYFRAPSQHHAPCVIVIHGGAWNSGSPDEFHAMNRHLAARGWNVAAIAHRFAPQWRWPAQLEDVAAAVAFLKANQAQLDLNPEWFVLLGRSSGGHLAESYAYRSGDPAVRGLIAFYAPADLNFAYQHSPENDILHSPQIMRDLLGGSPGELPANYDSASPIDFVNPRSPPTLLFHGPDDPLVWVLQSRRLSDRLEQAGVAHCLVELLWATHGFDYFYPGPGGQISWAAVDHFLDTLRP